MFNISLFNYDVIEDFMNINEAARIHSFFMKYVNRLR